MSAWAIAADAPDDGRCVRMVRSAWTHRLAPPARRCSRWAADKIDGVPLCSQHAAEYRLLMERRLIENRRVS